MNHLSYLDHMTSAIVYIVVQVFGLLFERAATVSIPNWIIVACTVTGAFVILKKILRFLIMSMIGAVGTYTVYHVAPLLLGMVR